MQTIGLVSGGEPSVVRSASGSHVYVALEGLRGDKVRDKRVSLSIVFSETAARQLWRKLGEVLAEAQAPEQ